MTCQNQILRFAVYALAMLAGSVAVAQQQTASASGGSAADIFVQTGHSQIGTMARFSPDGQRIATCDAGGPVIGWDAPSGRQYREIHQHVGMCLGLAFTPDGDNVLSSGGPIQGNDVVMSRWVDGAVVQRWEGYKGQVVDLIATPDGKGVWALGDRGVLLRWSLGAASPVQTTSLLLTGETAEQAPNNSTMVMAADQSVAYVARRDGTILKLQPGAAAPAVLLARLPETILALALSPDGQTLAVSFGSIQGATSKDVVLLSTRDGSEKLRLKGHTGVVSALAFSPDGRSLASAAQMDLNALLTGSMKDIKDNESLRLCRVTDGKLLADMRNERNANGSPFLRGSLAFSPPPNANSEFGTRVVMTLWDEAARVYQLDEAKGLRLVQTLESRGLAPRQLAVSDSTGRMLVSDARPRVAPPEVFLKAADIRREFGTDADWTPEREKRIEFLYGNRGLLSSVQRASMWDLKTGKLERVVDWQRAATSQLGVDAQGRFTSVAPLFPGTILIAPVRTDLVREATVDVEGKVLLRHFGYESWTGKPDEIFTAIPASAAGVTATAPQPVAIVPPGHADSYRSDLVVQSPSQRWTVVSATPNRKKDDPEGNLSRRLFVQERTAGGAQLARHDIVSPGAVRAMAVSANDATLWVVGTKTGLPYHEDHEGFLMAIDLASGKTVRSWDFAPNVTVDRVVAHPDGNRAVTDGTVALAVWDKREEKRKYRVQPSQGDRNIRALAINSKGDTIVTADLSGVTILWSWPQGAAPAEKWVQLLSSPSPDLLSFMAKDQRIAAGAGDGSVKLLASADGSEIARMIRFDTGEWITIIPEGYFVASQEGDRWVNVRMNGKVYGIDQFYDVFYRPDIVERKLAGMPLGFISVTMQDALQKPPPLVTVKLPAGATPAAGQKVRISLQALTQGGGVGEVRVLHNGKLVEVLNRAVVRTGLAPRPAAAMPAPDPSAQSAALTLKPQSAASGAEAVTRALRLAAQAQPDAASAAPPLQQLAGDVEVELIPGENSFSVIGFNGPGNLNARPVTRTVVAQGVAPKPRVFVLALGVDIFANPNAAPTLQYAVKDSGDFAKAVQERLAGTYRDQPVVVKLLQNENATRAGLTQALDDLQKELRPNDILVWFVASHGTLDNNNQYGIVLQDWDGRNNTGSLFSSTDILEASRRIRAFNQLVILDTCHAGGVSTLVTGLYDARLAVLARNMGLHVFASASATEEALDGYKGNGLFTHTLIDGLNTRDADKNADKQVTVNELGEFAKRETMKVAKLLRHSQEPLLLNFGKDVTIYAID